MRGQTRIKQIIDQEVNQIHQHSYKDKELGEVISLVESVLLDVDKGEVLRSSSGYERDLLVVTRQKQDWRCRQ